MGKSSAPPPPDYAALASQQGQNNKETAQFNAAANRVNQVTPQGSTTWSIRPGADMNNPKPGDYVQTTSLSPGQQGLYDSGVRVSQNLANTAESGLSRVSQAMGQQFNTKGLPGLSTMTAGGLPAPQIGYNGLPQQGLGDAGQVQSQVQTGNLPSLGNGQSYEASRKSVEDALMSRANPALAQAREGRETSLLNSGIEKGSEAWNREQANIGQTENDARMQAIMAGGAEQSRLAGLDLTARQQLYGEGVQSGNFANQAQNQRFSQGLAGAQFSNDTASQDFANRLSQGNFANQAQGQAFGQQQTTAGFNNAARQQGIQEQAYLRSLPLNELTALMSGAQVQSPQFQSYYTNNAAAAPIMDAGIAQGNYNMQAAQNRQSGANGLMGGLASLGSAYLMSDARLKLNVETIGQHPIGVRRVRWDWVDGSGEGRGVIAQELQAVKPEAVVMQPDGFLSVNYAMIGGF